MPLSQQSCLLLRERVILVTIKDIKDIIIAVTPFISGIIASLMTVLALRETKRKSKHDEMHEMYEDMKEQRDDALKQLDEMRKKND